MMRATLLIALMCFSAQLAEAYDYRYPPRYGTQPRETERRALEIETYRLQREQTEELRRLRNDLDDRDHEQKMERFRERIREGR